MTMVDCLPSSMLPEARGGMTFRYAWLGACSCSAPLCGIRRFKGCLGGLRRNESLWKLIGIESEDDVPQKWNLSRFLDSLGRQPHLTHLHGIH